MKQLVILCLCFHFQALTAQTIDEIDQRAAYFLERIEFWDDHDPEDEADSLSIYNEQLTVFLSNSLCANQYSLHADFELAKSKNLVISTSPDQKIRIYCWNTQTGGTMQYYNAIIQYSGNNYMTVEPLMISNEAENGSFYYEINQLTIDQKTHYIISSVNIGSSAVFSYLLETKTIDKKGELVESAIIKNDTNAVSSLNYEIDFSIEANNSFTLLDVEPVYDIEKRQIILPKMNAGYELEKATVIYEFNGKLFALKQAASD